jgi:hypothetical protein
MPQVLTEGPVNALTFIGGSTVCNFLSTEDITLIERDVRPHLGAGPPRKGDFFLLETRRASGLVGKSGTDAKKIV